MSDLVPRRDVLDTYWRFAAERQKIFFSRMAGKPGPWTEDKILREYKFCNAYRASDRLSQFLIADVIYYGMYSHLPEDVIFRILLFRLFNNHHTFRYLAEKLGEPTTKGFSQETYAKLLEERLAAGETIFGAAFILCANKAFGYDQKHKNYLALIDHMLKDGVVRKVTEAKSLEEVYNILLGYPLIGKFMAYQIATDINYSHVIDFDENSFTMAGPGAVRGIKKVFQSTGDLSNEDVIRWMVDHQADQFEELAIDPKKVWLFGRPLKAIDCQNLFCETDKYCRVAFPELQSNRSQIKASFKASPEAPITYFYPPKWNINQGAFDLRHQSLTG